MGRFHMPQIEVGDRARVGFERAGARAGNASEATVTTASSGPATDERTGRMNRTAEGRGPPPTPVRTLSDWPFT